MKKILFAVVFAILAAGSAMAVSAGSIDYRQVDAAGFDKLSDVQKLAVIKSVAEQAAATRTVVTEETIDKIDRWSQVGANLGKGLAATAKELGIAVNEFAATPIGKVATVLIVWHIMGASLMHVVGAIFMWTIGIYAVRFIFNRAYPADVSYNLEVRNVFGNHPVTKLDRPHMNGDAMVCFLIAHAVVLGAGTWILFTM